MSFVTVAAIGHPELAKRDDNYYIVEELIAPTKEKKSDDFTNSGKTQARLFDIGCVWLRSICKSTQAYSNIIQVGACKYREAPRLFLLGWK
jgi:hypothetical protein